MKHYCQETQPGALNIPSHLITTEERTAWVERVRAGTEEDPGAHLHRCRLLDGHLGRHECRCSWGWAYQDTKAVKLAGHQSQAGAPFSSDRARGAAAHVLDDDVERGEGYLHSSRHRAAEVRRALRGMGNRPDDEHWNE